MKLFIPLLIICSITCFGQSSAATDGLNDGYSWGQHTAPEKKLYVTGLADGVFVQSVMMDGACTGGTARPDDSLYPKGFDYADVVQGIDAFYKDRTNIKVPILFSYAYVMTKVKGASQQQLDAMAARFRQLANR